MSETSPSQSRPGSTPAAAELEILGLLSLADQCVKCGYCLPHCPTFKLAHEEAESPRGRIALIQGWLSGAISDGPRVQFHLDQCLACRACEPSCPSLVRYGRLIDGARALREQRRPVWQRWWRQARLALLTQPAGLRLLAAFGMGYRALRLPRRLIIKASRFWPALAILDPIARALRWPSQLIQPEQLESGLAKSPSPSPPQTMRRWGQTERAPVLFRGCVARLTEQPLEAAARRLLTRLGYPPEVPSDQGCCGAIHRHNGYPAVADQQIAANEQAFAGRCVIGLASACVAELREQGLINAVEVCRFLLDQPWPADISLQPLSAKVAVHEPCSHRNQLRDQAAVYQLLQRIPSLVVTPLPGNDTCCGAAGTYLTEHPEIALALAEPKIKALAQIQPDYLVTTNTGCALHLEARLRQAGLKTQVLHPIQLIERQLRLSPQPTQDIP